jgi:hypothetical protein
MMPRVGILVECGPDGLEVHVCGRICALLQLRTGIEIEHTIVSMTNKLALLEGCGLATRNLFDRGCERVVILWDERPAWPEKGEPLCWHHERVRILEELDRVSVSNMPVYLVCIEREFETWLLHDHVLLSALVSTKEHPKRIDELRNPEGIKNPKGHMKSLLKRYGRIYNDVQ